MTRFARAVAVRALAKAFRADLKGKHA